MRGMMDGWHGDEPEIEANYWSKREAYEDEHADDWKYLEERENEISE
jgi:hypothetical protein